MFVQTGGQSQCLGERKSGHLDSERTVVRKVLKTATGATTANFGKRISGLNLKIRDLRSFIVDTGRDENFVFAKVYTIQGLEGLGEGTLTGTALPVAKAVDGFKPFLLGKDPNNIGLLWQAMFRGPRYRADLVMGTAISAISAISAIEIAL